MLLVQVHLPLVELEGGDAARIDHLDADAVGRVQGPGDVVVDQLLVRARGHQAEQEVVAAQHDVSALVHDRRVAHLEMGLAGVDRQDRRLEAGGVAHLRVAVSCGEGAGCRVPRGGAGQVGAGHRIGAMVLGQHRAGDVELSAADVGVHVDGTGHDHPAGQVVVVVDRFIGGRGGDDPPVAQIQIADLAVHAVGGIVDPAALEPDQHRARPSRSRRRSRRAPGPRWGARSAAAPPGGAPRPGRCGTDGRDGRFPECRPG